MLQTCDRFLEVSNYLFEVIFFSFTGGAVNFYSCGSEVAVMGRVWNSGRTLVTSARAGNAASDSE